MTATILAVCCLARAGTSGNFVVMTARVLGDLLQVAVMMVDGVHSDHHSLDCPHLASLASPQMKLALVLRRLTLGLAATTARQGATLRSSRHGGEVWRYELELGDGRSQNRIRVEQVLSKFSGALEKIPG